MRLVQIEAVCTEVEDYDARPDTEAFSKGAIDAFYSGDWHYIGIVLSVTTTAVDDHDITWTTAAGSSLFGVESGYDRWEKEREYYRELINELWAEVIPQLPPGIPHNMVKMLRDAVDLPGAGQTFEFPNEEEE